MKINIRKSYLPLKNFHIVPIRGLSVDDIKWSAKNAIRDRESIKHSTALNAIAKAFGSKGGFAGYSTEETIKIERFLKDHNMIERSDLIIPRKFCQIGHQPLVTPQQISERFFLSDKPLPEKIFTGVN